MLCGSFFFLALKLYIAACCCAKVDHHRRLTFELLLAAGPSFCLIACMYEIQPPIDIYILQFSFPKKKVENDQSCSRTQGNPTISCNITLLTQPLTAPLAATKRYKYVYRPVSLICIHYALYHRTSNQYLLYPREH